MPAALAGPQVVEQMRAAWLAGAGQARLLDLHTLYFERPDPATLLSLDGPVGAEVRDLLAALGHPAGPAPADLDEALASWAGIANLEERIVAGHIDPLVLGQLRAA